MQVDNPLTLHFLENHPIEAARVLEKLDVQHSVSFLQEIEDELAARLVHYFMPNYLARCLPLMSRELLNQLAQQALHDICRCFPDLDAEQQKNILECLTPRNSRLVQHRLSYATGTVGRYVSRSCPVLTASLKITEAMQLLESVKYDSDCPLNLVDDEHRLLGSIHSARLLSAGKHDSLEKLISGEKRPAILISSQLLDLVEHSGWLSYRRLPVVDRNGIYMGELEYEAVKKYQDEFVAPHLPTETFGSLLSLAGVYWLSASWLVDSLFGSLNNKDD